MMCKITPISGSILLLLNSAILSTCPLEINAATINHRLDPPMSREILRRSKAADIKSWINKSKHPCKDFYKFACGNWQRINSAKTLDKYLTAKLTDITESNKERLYKWLNVPKTGNAVDDKLRDFYGSCKEIENNPELYKSALKKVYEEFGQFSFIKKRNDGKSTKDFNWWSTIAKINHVYGLLSLVYADVDYDIKSKNRTMIFINPPVFYMEEDQIKEDLSNFFGATPDEAKQMATDVNKLYEALAGAGTKSRSEKPLEEIYALHNTSDLQEEYKDLLDLGNFLMISFNITELPAQVYVYDKPYLDDLKQIVKDTDPNTLEDLILWSLLLEYLGDFSYDTIDSWCTTSTKRYFGKYIEHTIYEQYRSAEYEKEIYELWLEIRSVFQDQLQGDHYQWMSNATRKYAIKKLNRIQLKINSYDDENFEDFFRDLHIDPLNYVANVQTFLRHSESLREDKLQKRPERFDEVHLNSDSPFFIENELKILYPVEYLQPYHIWHPVYPKAIKYATIGNSLAHEMMHAFDDNGRSFDAEGNANNWWDDKSNNEFEKRRRCFQAQYRKYTYGGKHLPDSVAQAENIADNAGVKIAYSAFSRWLEKEQLKQPHVASTETFKNLSYNSQELFFLSYAQLWCEDVKWEIQSYSATDAEPDLHAPTRIRINAALSNFPTFSQVFKCDMKQKASMNPLQKCELF